MKANNCVLSSKLCIHEFSASEPGSGVVFRVLICFLSFKLGDSVRFFSSIRPCDYLRGVRKSRVSENKFQFGKCSSSIWVFNQQSTRASFSFGFVSLWHDCWVAFRGGWRWREKLFLREQKLIMMQKCQEQLRFIIIQNDIESFRRTSKVSSSSSETLHASSVKFN